MRLPKFLWRTPRNRMWTAFEVWKRRRDGCMYSAPPDSAHREVTGLFGVSFGLVFVGVMVQREVQERGHGIRQRRGET